MSLDRLSNETNLQHHKRLVYGKLIDKTLADVDYSELAEQVYGQQYSSDVARRMMYGSCKTLQLMDEARESVLPADMLAEIDEKKIELQKERQKFFDQRNAFSKVVRDRSRQEELNEILIDAIRSGNLPELHYEPMPIPCSDNDLLVSLNDIHYGANINNYWNTYNSEVCREMMCHYIDRIIPIANQHGSENCVIWANGDLINGNIHHSIAVTNKENVIEQITGVSELIAEFIAELSPHFANIRFISVAGNHSRMDIKDRALKDERLDDLVEWYLAARLQNFENVSVGTQDKIDSTMYVMDIRGKTYVGVHGDYDGSSGKIQALKTMADADVYAVLLGHKHHNSIDTVQGIKTVMAGSFLGMDDFCVSKRIYGHPEQLVCVCDESGIRCSYDIAL